MEPESAETKARMDGEEVFDDAQARVSKSRESRTRQTVAIVQGVNIQKSKQEQIGVGVSPMLFVLTCDKTDLGGVPWQETKHASADVQWQPSR